MKSICFFSHFHNGDIVNTKSFIREIVKSIDTKFYYGHFNNPIITKDLDLEYCPPPQIDHYTKFYETENCVYVNTWIGSYFSEDNEYTGECSLRGFYRMFKLICENLNNIFNVNIVLGDINDYYPFVDYSKFDCRNVDEFLTKDKNKKVLICNGAPQSGQCVYTGNMQSIVEELSIKHKNVTFICTEKFYTDKFNIKFTDDIIKSNTCDLNEISYLSKFCKLIVGRNSGPFCFTITKENIFDCDKVFYAFGNGATDSFPYEMEINCSFVFENFISEAHLFSAISDLVFEL